MNTADHVIYLDNAASVPVRPELQQSHAQLCAVHYANAHASNRLSELSRRACEQAALQLIRLAGAESASTRVIWTSGGTEANNLAMLGIMRTLPKGAAVLVESSAHNSLIACARQLECESYDSIAVPIRADGQFDLQRLAQQPLDNVALLALCHVNNETGVVQDLVAIRQWLRQHLPKAKLLVDASQSFGKLPLPWHEAQIDLLSLGAHKVGGPVGVGALLMRSQLQLQPLFFGGDQQYGLRPGTLDVVGILEFSQAAQLACQHREREYQRLHSLNQHCRQTLGARLGDAVQCLSPEDASPYILSVSLPQYQGAIVMRMLAERGIVVATGSACSAESNKLSHVLISMGLSRQIARGALRISFGPDTTMADINRAVEVLGDVLAQY